MRRAQGALEYLFVLAIAVVLIAVFMKKFFDPRAGTIKRVGSEQNSIEHHINETLQNMSNRTG